jgi:hypothetical protein
MGIFKTLARILAGFLLASFVAGLVQVLYVWTPAELASVPSAAFPAKAGSTLELSLLAATHSAIFGAAFALIAAGIAEWLSIRSIGYFLFAGTAIALLGFTAQYASEVSGQPTILNNYALQAYLTAGFFAGLAYWLAAGHRAGEHGRGDDYEQSTKSEEPRQRIIVEKTPAGVRKPGSLAEKLAKPMQAAAAAATAATKSATSVPVTKVTVTEKAAPSKTVDTATDAESKKA